MDRKQHWKDGWEVVIGLCFFFNFTVLKTGRKDGLFCLIAINAEACHMYCFVFLSQKSGSNNSQRRKISAQLLQPTDQHILELGNECKWQVFLDKFKRFGAGLAIFARGNMFGNMDVAMPAVPLGLDFFAKVLAGKFFLPPSLQLFLPFLSLGFEQMRQLSKES